MNARDVLRKYQKQLDEDGMEVGVSRQALDETLDYVAKLEAQLSECKQQRESICSQREAYQRGYRSGRLMQREKDAEKLDNLKDKAELQGSREHVEMYADAAKAIREQDVS